MDGLRTGISVSLITALGACGGGGGSSSSGNPAVPVETVGQTSQTLGNNPGDFVLTYDADTDRFVLLNDDSDEITRFVQRFGGTSLIRSDFDDSFGDFDNLLVNNVLIIGTAPSGATAAHLRGVVGGQEFSFVTLDRIGSTDVPLAGSTSYSGDYRANFFREGRSDIVTGKVELEVDFGDGLISGSVTDRDIGYLAASVFADIDLEEASLIDGEFSGSISGGEFSRASLNTTSQTSNGSYDGLITGQNADEVIGTLTIEHVVTNDLGTTNRIETGIFVAEAD